MDTVWLEVFREVARRGSFTSAAQALGYTQPAVSRQIAGLENEIGAALFDRLPRGVRLTMEGACFLAHAEAVLDRLVTARRDLADLRNLTAGRLRLGAFATSDAALVPRAMASFHQAHPDVALSLAEGRTAAQVTRLDAGDLDLAVISTAPDRLAGIDRLDLHHLLDDPMYVALPRAHPLAGRQTLRLADLAEESWIAGSAQTAETLIAASPQTGFRPRVEFVVGEWIAKQGLVEAGLGITLIPSLAAGSVRPDIVLVALDPADAPVRSVYAATPKGVAGPTSVAVFLGYLREAAAEVRAEVAAVAPTGL